MDKQNKKKIEELQTQLVKALADYSNLEKDMNRRIEMRVVAQKVQIGRSMMEIMDAMNMALKAKDSLQIEGNAKAWVDGVASIVLQIEKALGELEIIKMVANVGDVYNSTYHEALGTVNEGEKGKIHEVIQPGYMLGDYVVRPARVIVCNGKV